MHLFIYKIIFTFLLFQPSGGESPPPFLINMKVAYSADQDTVFDRQILFNGRIWKKRYSNVLDHEFFLTGEWLRGDVNINARSFSNVMLKYDLFNDELLIMFNPGTVVILSNEKVESFILKNGQGLYKFLNYNPSGSPLLKGYGHLAYDGNTSLVIKYNKQIKTLAVDNKYDEFYQKHQVFILSEGRFSRIRSKRDLLDLLEDHREEIQKHIRDKGLNVSVSKPETLIPVLQFYDSIIQKREK